MKYLLQDRYTKQYQLLTMVEILEFINRDRSEEWTDYNSSDFKEGLSEFTELDYIGNVI